MKRVRPLVKRVRSSTGSSKSFARKEIATDKTLLINIKELLKSQMRRTLKEVSNVVRLSYAQKLSCFGKVLPLILVIEILYLEFPLQCMSMKSC